MSSARFSSSPSAVSSTTTTGITRSAAFTLSRGTPTGSRRTAPSCSGACSTAAARSGPATSRPSPCGPTAAAYELGGLSAGEPAASLYRSLGWRRWEGRTWVLGPSGLERTPDEDETTYVLPLASELDLSGDLACDWRDGDVW
jgi:hypothetical protein